VYTYMYVCVRVYKYMYVCVRVYKYMYVCVRVYKYMYVCVRVYTCVLYVHVCICMHIFDIQARRTNGM